MIFSSFIQMFSLKISFATYLYGCCHPCYLFCVNNLWCAAGISEWPHVKEQRWRYCHQIWIHVRPGIFMVVSYLKTFYHSWKYFTIRGNFLPYVGILYHPCEYFTFCGNILPSMGIFYHPWEYVTLCRNILPSVGIFYLMWEYFNIRGNIWPSLLPFVKTDSLSVGKCILWVNTT